MSAKELVLRSIKKMSADATIEQINERVTFLAALQKADESFARGENIAHADVVQQFQKWSQSWQPKSSGRPKRSKTSAK